MKKTLFFLGLVSLIFSTYSFDKAWDTAARAQNRRGNDAIIRQTVTKFSSAYNRRDISAMERMLPNDFMLQWLHENFLEKDGLLIMMLDTLKHGILKHRLSLDSNTIIRYSDDLKSASLNAGFEFLDKQMMEAARKEKGYGLCILYLQKRNGRWRLQTVHFDLHCSICNL
jgi:hypothetical protein